MSCKLDLSKPVQTRDGRKVRIIYNNLLGTNHPIVAIVRESRATETIERYTVAGKYFIGNESGSDLVNIPTKRKKKKGKKTIGWVNVIGFADEMNFNLSSVRVYPTEKEAIQNLISDKYITTVKIKVNVNKLKKVRK